MDFISIKTFNTIHNSNPSCYGNKPSKVLFKKKKICHSIVRSANNYKVIENTNLDYKGANIYALWPESK